MKMTKKAPRIGSLSCWRGQAMGAYHLARMGEIGVLKLAQGTIFVKFCEIRSATKEWISQASNEKAANPCFY